VTNLLLQSSDKINARLVAKTFYDGCKIEVEKTKNMRPKSGRASYSMTNSEASSDLINLNYDPGAYAIMLISKSISKIFLKNA
jgi:hypothetical protein